MRRIRFWVQEQLSLPKLTSRGIVNVEWTGVTIGPYFFGFCKWIK